MSNLNSDNPLLLPVSLDSETIRKTIITNFISMLIYRNLLDKNKWDKKYIEEYCKKKNDNNIYKFSVDFQNNLRIEDDINKKYIYLIIMQEKINSLNSSPIITDFINTYKNNYKFLVFLGISDKAKLALNTLKNTEGFTENFFMIDLMSHVCSPDYEILNNDEILELKKSYEIDNRKINKILHNDPASLYLGLKKGDVVRIIRDSEQSGRSIGYRRVK